MAVSSNNGCRCNETTMSTADEALIDIVELILVSVEKRRIFRFNKLFMVKYKPTTCAGNKTSNTSECERTATATSTSLC
jgi:hypothetical protein